MVDLQRYRLPGLERRFSQGPRNRAYLVILQLKQKSEHFFEESTAEMKELASAAGIRVVGTLQANLPQPSPSHFLREGKLTQLRDEALKAGANLLIFNVELTPPQGSNIEAFSKISVLDRTGLILDIFGRRAKSREGKLQVELAQMTYALPRLGGLGGVMSRLGGGVGTRGPGEQELERDRRKVRRRIQQLKEELEKVKKHRALIRSGRKKKNFISVALVGYTNAGKSTLLNTLTGATSYVEDKMFATLDPVARVESINGRRDVLFIDTVGFLKDLPHTLVQAFRATLEEVAEVDVLLHVLDVSNPKCRAQKQTVEEVLKEIGAGGKPCVLALNKADLLDSERKDCIRELWPDGILISAREKLGMKGLLEKLEGLIDAKQTPE